MGPDRGLPEKVPLRMSLAPDTTLGGYLITSALGAGGMGEVWRATDEKLGREVALKVLPEEFAGDPERMARFDGAVEGD